MGWAYAMWPVAAGWRSRACVRWGTGRSAPPARMCRVRVPRPRRCAPRLSVTSPRPTLSQLSTYPSHLSRLPRSHCETSALTLRGTDPTNRATRWTDARPLPTRPFAQNTPVRTSVQLHYCINLHVYTPHNTTNIIHTNRCYFYTKIFITTYTT